MRFEVTALGDGWTGQGSDLDEADSLVYEILEEDHGEEVQISVIVDDEVRAALLMSDSVRRIVGDWWSGSVPATVAMSEIRGLL